MKFSRKTKAIIKEIAAVAFITMLSGLIGVHTQEYLLTENNSLRLAPSIVGISPILAFYIAARLFLHCVSALLFTTATLYLLSYANNLKQSLTGEPLAWSDISTNSNLSVIQHYTSHFDLALALVAIASAIFAIHIFRQAHFAKINQILTSSLLLIPLLAIGLHPYADKIGGTPGETIQSKMLDGGVRYYSWDWAENVKRAGLPLHLIQTSRREIPDQPNAKELEAFNNLTHSPPLSDRPKNVIFILCEACWFDENYFQSAFRHLDKFAPANFRVISPAYGGGTVNAAFELLTGLPSHGALTGVIYQEYADIMRKDAATLPRAMKSLGYKTVAAHNHYRKFWRRDIIKPKMGFDTFFALEDMNYTGPIWADDSILFNKTLAEIEKSKTPSFYFLTTVSTHGSYPFDGDRGERNYLTRLEKSISQMASFIDKVLNIDPDSAILVVSDHKPALTKFFYDQGILPKSLFSRVGDRNEDFRFKASLPRNIVGDVPALLIHSNKAKAEAFAINANSAPLYCVPHTFDRLYLGADLPVFAYARQNSLCAPPYAEDYSKEIQNIPEYIYSLSMIY